VQFEKTPKITYAQNEWAELQDCDSASTNNLVSLWSSYNYHLAHIISNIPADKKDNLCDIGKDHPVTLEWLINDYIRHLKHHLNQIMI
jgi:hypothetical protein